VLHFVLSEETPGEDDFENEHFLKMHEDAFFLYLSKNLYGLVHARFIQTPVGLAMMREKFLTGTFGHCPRLDCEKQNLLPIGTSNNLKIAKVKVRFEKSPTVRAAKTSTSPRRSAGTSTAPSTAPPSPTFCSRYHFTLELRRLHHQAARQGARPKNIRLQNLRARGLQVRREKRALAQQKKVTLDACK